MQRKVVKPSLCLDMSHAAKFHRAVTLVPSPPQQEGYGCLGGSEEDPFPHAECTQHTDTSLDRAKRRKQNQFHATAILDGFLYLDSFTDAMQRSDMLERGITHVLNVARECDSENTSEPDHEACIPATLFKFLKVDVCDHSDEDIGRHFEECLTFIEDARLHNGKVLVHCRQGISRSPTIVIAYLMSVHDYTLDDALHYVQSKRESVCPNIGFILTLEEYACCGAQEFQRLHNGKLSPPGLGLPSSLDCDDCTTPYMPSSSVTSDPFEGMFAPMNTIIDGH